MYSDKTLVCKECGEEFTFSASEQEFYAEKGFQNEPARCSECRQKRRRQKNDGGGEREMFNVVCDQCGVETQVPFRPTNGRPIYCRECLQQQRDN
ncbi:MAG: zinc-ribbon domain containing protein [Clostridiales bacterium]